MAIRKTIIQFVVAALFAAPVAVSAQGPLPKQEPGDAATAKPGLLGRIGIDQRLNEQVPLDLAFVDENGRDVTLREYFGKRPVLLALVYYECPMLCTLVLNGLESSLRALYGDAVFATTVPHAADYPEAIAARKPVALYKPKGASAKVMKALAEELESRLLHGAAQRGEAA